MAILWNIDEIRVVSTASHATGCHALEADMYHIPATCKVTADCLADAWSRIHILEASMYINRVTCNDAGGWCKYGAEPELHM